MLSKINICNILKGHLRTLRNEGASRIERKNIAQPSDYILFFILPIPVAIAGYFFTNPLDGFALTITATAFAIMAGLLLNLLVLVYQILTTTRKSSNRESKMTLLSDTYNNISFLILVALSGIISLVLTAVFGTEFYVFSKVLTSIVYYVSIVFVLTLIMVIKRIHVLLDH